ncbi:MAG: polysaccharide deacetylase family protein [Bacteroidetes bacterium]|nr:polysaccharide deacetylase family protein [Bacteroidota bacterium]
MVKKQEQVPLHWLLPSIKGIPVLMYHRVWPGTNDGLTISPEKLKQQWQYLKNEGCSTLSLSQFVDIVKNKLPYPKKSILLTFDDGYRNNLQYVYPLLKELNWSAAFFIIADTLTQTKDEPEINRKMNLQELKSLDPSIVQLALHGLHHEHFSRLTNEQIQEVLEQSIQAFEMSSLPFHKVLAYPYGDRPKNKKQFDELKSWMKTNGIEAAFRIGNKVVKIPAPDVYEIKRIDIKGTDTMDQFRIKLKKGKLKPF